MSKPKPSLEELAAEHNVDLDFLKQFQEGMNQANEAQDRWAAWRKPLLEKTRQIEALVRVHPKQDVHPLDRPGIAFAQSTQIGNDMLLLFIDVPGYPSVSLKFDPFDGISIAGDIVVQSGDGKGSMTVQAIAELDRSWSSQSPDVRNNWPAPFEETLHVLSCVCDALQHNTPVGGVTDWPTALHDHLAQPPNSFERVDRWVHWVDTWATPEMQRSFHVVEGLFDYKEDASAWREHLLSSWSQQARISPEDSLDAASIALLGHELN